MELAEIERQHTVSNEKPTSKDSKPRTRRGGIDSITGPIGTVIVGGTGPIHTGNGDVYVNGKKQPKTN